LGKKIGQDCLGDKTTPDLEVDKEAIGYRWQDVNWKEIASHWSEEYEQL
jgi:hypothetical protein